MIFTEDEVYAAVPEDGSAKTALIVLRAIQARYPDRVKSWMDYAVCASWRWPESWMRQECEEIAHHLREMLSSGRVAADAHWELYRPRRPSEVK